MRQDPIMLCKGKETVHPVRPRNKQGELAQNSIQPRTYPHSQGGNLRGAHIRCRSG
jgi:hypothetical protein